MSDIQTNLPDSFSDTANENSLVSDQFFNFNVPTAGSSVGYNVIPSFTIDSSVEHWTPIDIINFDDAKESMLLTFKATQTNITGIRILTKSVWDSTHDIIDDCEYPTDNDARAVWVSTDLTKLSVKRDDREKYDGLYALKFDPETDSEGQSATRTFATNQDWSVVTDLGFYWRDDRHGNDSRWRYDITDDAGNTASVEFNASVDRTWEEHRFLVENLINTELVDWENIKSISFYSVNNKDKHKCVVDNIFILAAPTQMSDFVSAQLVHLGADGFTTSGTVLTLDDGTTTATQDATFAKLMKTSLKIAADLCIYTNDNIKLHTLED